MKRTLTIILGWIAWLLPAALTLHFLHPDHGWTVSALAALGVYMIIGILLFLRTAWKAYKKSVMKSQE